MRTKVLILALIGALLALPLPAGQLAGTFSTSAPTARIVPGDENLATLIADPVQAGDFTYAPPRSFLETGATQSL